MGQQSFPFAAINCVFVPRQGVDCGNVGAAKHARLCHSGRQAATQIFFAAAVAMTPHRNTVLGPFKGLQPAQGANSHFPSLQTTVPSVSGPQYYGQGSADKAQAILKLLHYWLRPPPPAIGKTLTFAPQSIDMRKIILPVLFLVCTMALQAQKKLKPADLVGTWQVSAMIADGNTIPLESNEAIRGFLMQQYSEKAGPDRPPLSKDDSAGIDMAVTVMASFRNSTFEFKANKSYAFEMTVSTQKNTENGTWAFNQATQTVLLKAMKKGKPAKSEIVKIIPKGDQLLIQMEKNKEEGFLVSKQQ
jgi:hypothetical protein